MKEKFRKFIKDKFISFSFWSALAGVIVVAILVLVTYGSLNPYVPLLNSLPWGEERLVESKYVLIVPISACIIYILNSLISIILYNKYVLISRILAINALLFVMFGLLSYAHLLLLVF